jgi:hypothetical protein
MALSAKEKRVKGRLEQIKERAAEMNMNDEKGGADLAEEAAGLGLELLEEGS